ncbi:hypothetical protein SLS61_008856 [Didymella pomorum]
MNVILPPSQAYATDRASQTLLSSNFDKIPALFDLPQFEDELRSPLHPAKAHDLRLPEGFDNMGEYLDNTDIDRLFSEQELDKQAQSNIANSGILQNTANEKRDASLSNPDERPTATPGDSTAPVKLNDMQAPATGDNRFSFVASDPPSSAESTGNIASASESGAASCEVLHPEQDVDRATGLVESRSEPATEAVEDGSSPQSVPSSQARHSASVITENLLVLPERPSRISDEVTTSMVPAQASIEKSPTSTSTLEVSKGASSCEPAHGFTQLGYSDCSPCPTTPEVCEHAATDNKDRNESPESLPHNRALISACQTTNTSGNGRAVAGSKRKHAKKTLISKPQKQDAALQVAWVETQSIWVGLKPLLQGATKQNLTLQPHTVALVTKFENLCGILLDKECVDDPALVLDIVSAWRTVQKLSSLEHDAQNAADQFERQLAAFHEQVDLHMDIGKCLDEEQDRRKKARHRRA